jgi:hypothetical protein
MLNGKVMAGLATIFFISILMVSPAVAALVAKLPVMAEVDQKSLVADVGVELVQYSDDLIKSIGQHLGLVPLEEPSYAITFEDQVLAVVPPGSKLIGTQMHNDCMQWGYGSDNWWVCEKRIDDTENLDWSKVLPEVYAIDDTAPPIEIEPIETIGIEPIIKEKI